MARPSKKLRMLLLENELNQADLPPIIGKSLSYVANRINGYQSFTTTDIALLAPVLNLPQERWVEVFFQNDLESVKQ